MRTLLASLLMLVLGLGLVQASEPHHVTIVSPGSDSGPVFGTERMVSVKEAGSWFGQAPLDGLDAADGLPGVFVQRTNRGAGAPLFRGLIGPQNVVLLDGMRFNLSTFRTGPNQYAALVDPLVLGSVEVLVGPSSLLYGSEGMGGALNYLTRPVSDEEGWHAEVQVSGASADTGLHATGLVGGRSGDWAGWAQVGYRKRHTLRVGGGDTVPLSGFEQLDFAAKLQWRPSATLRFDLVLVGTQLPDARRIDNIGKGDIRRYDNGSELGYLRLVHRPTRSVGLTRAEVRVGLHRLDETVDRRRCERDDDGAVVDRIGCIAASDAAVTSTTQHRDDTLAVLAEAHARLEWLSGRLVVDLGIDGRFESVGSEASEGTNSTFPDGASAFTAGGFVHGKWWPYVDPGTFELKLTGGVRGTYGRADASGVTGLGDVAYDHAGFAGSASVSAIISERLNLYGSWVQGFRAPNLQETTALGDTGSTFEVPNPDLQQETSDTFEAGFKWGLPEAHIAVGYFRSVVEDAVVREASTFNGESSVDGKDVFKRVNASRSRFDGIEFGAVVSPLPELRLEGSFSIIDGVVYRTSGAAGELPRRLPPLNGSVAVVGSIPSLAGLQLGARLRFAAAQPNLAPADRRDLRICGDPAADHQVLDDCAGTPGWQRFGLSARITPMSGLDVGLAVDNLFDTNYRWHGSGFDAPGRDFKLTLRYRL